MNTLNVNGTVDAGANSVAAAAVTIDQGGSLAAGVVTADTFNVTNGSANIAELAGSGATKSATVDIYQTLTITGNAGVGISGMNTLNVNGVVNAGTNSVAAVTTTIDQGGSLAAGVVTANTFNLNNGSASISKLVGGGGTASVAAGMTLDISGNAGVAIDGLSSLTVLGTVNAHANAITNGGLASIGSDDVAGLLTATGGFTGLGLAVNNGVADFGTATVDVGIGLVTIGTTGGGVGTLYAGDVYGSALELINGSANISNFIATTGTKDVFVAQNLTLTVSGTGGLVGIASLTVLGTANVTNGGVTTPTAVIGSDTAVGSLTAGSFNGLALTINNGSANFGGGAVNVAGGTVAIGTSATTGSLTGGALTAGSLLVTNGSANLASLALSGTQFVVGANSSLTAGSGTVTGMTTVTIDGTAALGTTSIAMTGPNAATIGVDGGAAGQLTATGGFAGAGLAVNNGSADFGGGAVNVGTGQVGIGGAATTGSLTGGALTAGSLLVTNGSANLTSLALSGTQLVVAGNSSLTAGSGTVTGMTTVTIDGTAALGTTSIAMTGPNAATIGVDGGAAGQLTAMGGFSGAGLAVNNGSAYFGSSAVNVADGDVTVGTTNGSAGVLTAGIVTADRFGVIAGSAGISELVASGSNKIAGVNVGTTLDISGVGSVAISGLNTLAVGGTVNAGANSIDSGLAMVEAGGAIHAGSFTGTTLAVDNGTANFTGAVNVGSGQVGIGTTATAGSLTAGLVTADTFSLIKGSAGIGELLAGGTGTALINAGTTLNVSGGTAMSGLGSLTVLGTVNAAGGSVAGGDTTVGADGGAVGSLTANSFSGSSLMVYNGAANFGGGIGPVNVAGGAVQVGVLGGSAGNLQGGVVTADTFSLNNGSASIAELVGSGSTKSAYVAVGQALYVGNASGVSMSGLNTLTVLGTVDATGSVAGGDTTVGADGGAVGRLAANSFTGTSLAVNNGAAGFGTGAVGVSGAVNVGGSTSSGSLTAGAVTADMFYVNKGSASIESLAGSGGTKSAFVGAGTTLDVSGTAGISSLASLTINGTATVTNGSVAGGATTVGVIGGAVGSLTANGFSGTSLGVRNGLAEFNGGTVDVTGGRIEVGSTLGSVGTLNGGDVTADVFHVHNGSATINTLTGSGSNLTGLVSAAGTLNVNSGDVSNLTTFRVNGIANINAGNLYAGTTHVGVDGGAIGTLSVALDHVGDNLHIHNGSVAIGGALTMTNTVNVGTPGGSLGSLTVVGDATADQFNVHEGSSATVANLYGHPSGSVLAVNVHDGASLDAGGRIGNMNSVNISGTGVVKVGAGATPVGEPATTSVIKALSITESGGAPTGLLDVSGTVVIDGSALSPSQFASEFTQVQAWAARNYNGGLWGGSTEGAAGIGSSRVYNDQNNLGLPMGLAVVNNDYVDPDYGEIALFPWVSDIAKSIIIKYTYQGDANLDGTVNGADYNAIDTGAGMGLTGWENGDFDYSGAVDGADYNIIDTAAGMIGEGASEGMQSSLLVGAVPEPATLGLMVLGLVAALANRRRRSAKK